MNNVIQRRTNSCHGTAGRQQSGFSLIELLVVIAVIGILICLVLPFSRVSRGAARRTECQNKLKQLALGIHNYHDVHGTLPPVFTRGDDEQPLHSWRTLLLPYLEQSTMYDRLDLTKPVTDSANSLMFQTMVKTFRCPEAVLRPHHTTYLAIATPDSCLRLGEPRKFTEIPRMSETWMLIESHHEQSVPWMSTQDASESLVLSFGPKSKLPHPGGQHVAFADGSIHFVSAKESATARRAAITVKPLP